MNCKTCKYPLWNMKERRCPECGDGFSVRDFFFGPGNVQFKCPHCSQSYYGTDARTGHLVPESFACVKCGAAVTMDEMLVVPTAGVTEVEAASDHHPWIEPEKGLVRSWMRAVTMSCFQPRRLMELTPASATAGRALKFLIMTMAVVALTGLGPLLGFVLVMEYGAPGTGTYGTGPSTSKIAEIVVPIAGGGVLFIATALAWMAISHGLLWLAGSQQPMRRTIIAACYTCGPLVIMSVPCVGVYIVPLALVWWMVNAAIVMGLAHGIGPWRAALATVMAPVTALALLVAWIASLIFSNWR